MKAHGLIAYPAELAERKERMGRTVDEALDEACRPLQLCRLPTLVADTRVRDTSWTVLGRD